jgi:hypothetical protein
MAINLNELSREIHKNAVEHGWWPEKGLLGSHERYDAEFPGKIALVHSELSEALEAFRDHHGTKQIFLEDEHGEPLLVDPSRASALEHTEFGFKPEGIPVELADVIIRVLDMAGAYGMDIQRALDLKMSYNRSRAHKHGGKKV